MGEPVEPELVWLEVNENEVGLIAKLSVEQPITDGLSVASVTRHLTAL